MNLLQGMSYADFKLCIRCVHCNPRSSYLHLQLIFWKVACDCGGNINTVISTQ